MQLRLREVGRLAQGDPATSGIAGAGAHCVSHTPRRRHAQPASKVFISEPRQPLHFKARPSPLSPRRCPPPPTPAPSPASIHPPPQSPRSTHSSHAGQAGPLSGTQAEACLAGRSQAVGSRDSPVEASAAISCLLGHHPQHLAPPPGPSLPHVPTQWGLRRLDLHTDRGCGAPGPAKVARQVPRRRPGPGPARPASSVVRLEAVVQPSSGLNGGRVPGAGGPLRPIRSASPDTKHPNQAAAPRSHILCRHKLSPWGPSQKRQLPNAIISR